MGVKKPETGAFEAVFAARNINPEHWLYIDDRESNLQAASDYGVEKTILYTQAARLRKDLAACGVLGKS
ncbi:hypothetical protein HYX10_01635 [Candidatus Woesearchaeota archaeon]|nr:hypothetical protein [Candidatus Woesearchaeota archaeon]